MKSCLIGPTIITSIALNITFGTPAVEPWMDLPTENRALFASRPEQFYMYVDRDFEGVKSKSIEGGMFGFTRNPKRFEGQIVFTRFHEGIDIAPVRRDARGEPLDPVYAAADGTVVHVSKDEKDSNYGIYAVLEHKRDGALFYTLYAHLAEVSVAPGQTLRRGERIGRLGYTGVGINRERAHLHFEICLPLSENFDAWHAFYFPKDRNKHGLYNGMNLAGLDPARFLKALRSDPSLTIPAFLEKTKPLFSITIPASENFSLIRLNPWLVVPGEPASPPAWTITFNEWLLPIRVQAAPVLQNEPVVKWLGPANPPPAMQTQNRIGGTAKAPVLSVSGRRFVHLLAFPE